MRTYTGFKLIYLAGLGKYWWNKKKSDLVDNKLILDCRSQYHSYRISEDCLERNCVIRLSGTDWGPFHKHPIKQLDTRNVSEKFPRSGVNSVSPTCHQRKSPKWGRENNGELIPGISIITTGCPFEFKPFQFPVRQRIAMTIDEAQW